MEFSQIHRISVSESGYVRTRGLVDDMWLYNRPQCTNHIYINFIILIDCLKRFKNKIGGGGNEVLCLRRNGLIDDFISWCRNTTGHLTDYDRCSRNSTKGSSRCLRKGFRADGQLRCSLQTWSDCILMPSVSFYYQWQSDQQICNLHFNWAFTHILITCISSNKKIN